jgi:ribonuclease R
MAKNKKKDGGGNGRNKRSIKSSLINFLHQNPGESFNYKQIAARMGLHSHEERDILLSCLEELLKEGQLDELDRGKYTPTFETQYVEGKVDMTKAGSAFIIVPGAEDDIYVGSNKLKTALHGDQVKVLLYARRNGKRPEGEVVEVLERRKLEFAGIVQVHERFAFLVPDDKRMVTDIFIPISKLGEAQNGEKAIVRIVEWPEGGKSPIGEVVQVLGKPGEHTTEMNAIIAEFNLPTSFPAIVERDAEAIPEAIPEEEIEKRWDFRGTATFTIDPVDAKDFDDALSMRKLDNGQWEVGIHIADVSYYVREGTPLDKEALERGTSVYLVDRVIPMLPEKLSNNLCSLRPNEDKLAFSVVVVLDDEANVVQEWYGRTVINSQKRFAYEEAQEILEGAEGPFSEELHTLNRLAYKLRERKFAEGAISFETEEVKFKLDENGKPLGVYKKVRKDAHKLIEDFMLLANRKVAEFIFKKNETMHDKPFVYRVHDKPNDEKLEAFARVAATFGYRVNTTSEKAIAQSLNRLLINVEGKPEQNMLQTLAIRSMAKAFYTTTKSSHYGLAFDYYTHFTSPIRRYPDVIAHRLLAFYLSGGKGVDQDYIEMQCQHSSEMEVRAAEAERASIKYKQVEYMQDKVGMEFDGLISGVTEWGIYVEMTENKCEGMVRISDLRDDYYNFDEDRFLIRGFNTGKTYQLGDAVRVKVAAANLQQRTIDLVMLDDLGPIANTREESGMIEPPADNSGKPKSNRRGTQPNKSKSEPRSGSRNRQGSSKEKDGSANKNSQSQKSSGGGRGRKKKGE